MQTLPPSGTTQRMRRSRHDAQATDARCLDFCGLDLPTSCVSEVASSACILYRAMLKSGLRSCCWDSCKVRGVVAGKHELCLPRPPTKRICRAVHSLAGLTSIQGPATDAEPLRSGARLKRRFLFWVFALLFACMVTGSTRVPMPCA